MVKSTNKSQRRLVKKLTRLQQDGAGPQPGEGGADGIPALALAGGVLPSPHLRTRREGFLRKAFSASAQAAPAALYKRQGRLAKGLKASSAATYVAAAGQADEGEERGGGLGMTGVLHRAAREAVRKPRRKRNPRRTGETPRRRTPAEEKMDAAQEELRLYDKVVNVPEFVVDPFAAIQQHLNMTMETLKPLTPDVGRLP